MGLRSSGPEGSEQFGGHQRRGYATSGLIGRERSIRGAKQNLHCEVTKK